MIYGYQVNGFSKFSILGDYAWGREGLDTIVTQLLNQMDNAGKFNYKLVQYYLVILWLYQSGPPPLEPEKIAEIPKCEIIQEQVDSKLQCSVCWDDFKLHEVVRQLPCSVTNYNAFMFIS